MRRRSSISFKLLCGAWEALCVGAISRKALVYTATYFLSHALFYSLIKFLLSGIQDEYVRQLKETKAKFLLIDEETAPQMQVAAARLDWKVKFVTFKKLNMPDSVSVEDLMQDDGTGT
jgi:hypothetical protein